MSEGKSYSGAREFEDLVADLFVRLDFSVQREKRIGGVSLDMLLERDGMSFPVEVSAQVGGTGLAKLLADAARLKSLLNQGLGMSTPIIICATPLTTAARAWSESQFQIQIWDRGVLDLKVAPFPDLAARLAALVYQKPEQKFLDAEETSDLGVLQKRLRDHIKANTLSPTDYENLCMSVFRRLFDPYLYGFERQAETSDGGNRYDFICRILPGSAFWDSIRHDFRTKAILFECKNYNDRIGPDQVYSTERYLFASALRTVCFLVSRLGPNAGAVRAAQGAMRESGKLIILLSNNDLVEMLDLKTQAGGPEALLDKRVWDFIVSLPR
jgi:hypothetical protein